MLFSSTAFLFAFLPIVLTLHLLLRSTSQRNVLLLAASLFFYAWGELGWVVLLVASGLLNWAFAAALEMGRGRRALLALAVATNLLGLGVFKYANFAVDALNLLLAPFGVSPIELAPVHLPIGISFFTFQAITYVVDVYRRDAPVQRNPFQVLLYIALFPQLIAGPIVRYAQVAAQLVERHARSEDLAAGAQRFVIGLAKKVLIANTLALSVDRIFALPPDELGWPLAWLGLAGYALQIYFDFSGYSDMAIGIGRMLGFRFPENFAHPYVARSMREFWRRWHMSLSTWFRDYLYIPLGGNRRGAARTAWNLALVFLLCGLWHGAAWNFAVWGALHGAFLIAERGAFGRALARAPRGLQHGYVCVAVLVAWVFFRADDLPHALGYLGQLVAPAPDAALPAALALLFQPDFALAFTAACVGATPWPARLAASIAASGRQAAAPLGAGVALAGLALLFLVSAASLAAGTYNPFIYFRF